MEFKLPDGLFIVLSFRNPFQDKIQILMVKYKVGILKNKKAEGYLTLRSVKFFLSWQCELTPPLKPIRGIIKFKCLLSSIV